MLTIEQKIFVVQCYGLGEISYEGVVRRFQQFPEYSLSSNTVKNIVTRFSRTGSVQNEKNSIKKSNDDTNEEECFLKI